MSSVKNFIPNIDIDFVSNGESDFWNTKDYYIPDTQKINHLIKYFPYRQNYYQVSLCIAGQCRIKVEGEERYAEKNVLSAFTPLTVVEVLEASEDFECEIVLFKKSFLEETLNNIYFMERFSLLNNVGLNYLKISENNRLVLKKSFDLIRKKMKEKDHQYRREIIRSLIIILLYEAENIFSQSFCGDTTYENIVGRDKLLADFKDLVQKNFYRERKVAFYSSNLGLTTGQLSRILKERTGRNAKEYIEHILLSQAKVMLKSRKLNVTEVATMLHYENTEEFSRFFKRKVGVSPLRYQKESF
ncbi:AraC family transcriptional regulator [Sphingobacterium sp.]|uniref:helix-turn-helix domain-containing protein n=1 Tax=Sphingobacterium sp. TaxID=341027 RepID=UPI0031D945A1